jgi:hypothetical protein
MADLLVGKTQDYQVLVSLSRMLVRGSYAFSHIDKPPTLLTTINAPALPPQPEIK